MKKQLQIIALVLLPFIAYSQERFEYVTSSKDGKDYYTKIVKKDSEYEYSPLKVWVKSINKTKTFKNKNGKLVTTGGEYTLALMEISCRLKTYIVKQLVTYNKAGNITDFVNNYSSTVSKEIVPDSIMEKIFYSVCSE